LGADLFNRIAKISFIFLFYYYKKKKLINLIKDLIYKVIKTYNVTKIFYAIKFKHEQNYTDIYIILNYMLAY